MTGTRWFDRAFPTGRGAEDIAVLLERLEDTPDRLVKAFDGVSEAQLRVRLDGKWSIQENAGHLWDLESLWRGRIDDLASGRSHLREADLANRLTWDRDHNTIPAIWILVSFEVERAGLVRRVRELHESETVLSRTALHPRLETPMTLADLLFFVAEHDDHHLARIAEIAAQLQ